MPIEVKLTAETPEELHNLAMCVFNPQRLVNAEISNQNIEAAGSLLPGGKKPRASRKPAEPAAEESAEGTEPKFLKKFEVYKADGSRFSGFATEDKALDQLAVQIAACGDTEQLNSLTSHNTDTVGMFTEKTQELFAEKVDERFNELTAAEEEQEEADDGKPATEQQVKDAVTLFTKTHGLIPAKEVISGMGANKVSELKPAQYKTFIKKLKEKGDKLDAQKKAA